MKLGIAIGCLTMLLCVSSCSVKQAPAQPPGASVADAYTTELNERTLKLSSYEIDKSKMLVDDPRLCRDLYRDARKYREEGNWAESESTERKLSVIRDKWLGKTMSDSAFSVTYIAQSMRHQNRAEEALHLVENRLALLKKDPADESRVGLISLLVEKGEDLIVLNRKNEAADCFTEALALRAKVPRYIKFGPKADEIEKAISRAK